MVPKAVLMRSGLVSLTTAKPVNITQPRTTVNSARPMTNVFNKAHSTVRRPINNKTATKNSNSNQRINTDRGNNVNTARPKAVLNVVKGNQVNVVKVSACWVWKPKTKVLDHVSQHNGNPQQDLQEKGVIDSGCSRHMTGNMSYLTNFEEIDKGYVTFGGNPKEGKITGRVPRKNNMYSADLKNIVPKGGLTCLIAKATSDESKLWHRRLGHINFKTMNKLVKGKLVRRLPLKLFENNQTCVACQKGKQHRASYQRVKVIRCDNGTEFKNKEMNQFCERKCIKREFSVARTPQQNEVAERKNRTLIEAARTILADSKLPTTFWAKAVNIACYVQNRVLVTKPHNKTPYELFLGIKPALGFMRPLGCLVTILNTIDHLGKFDGKANEGFFVGYSINSKAFKVFNSRTRIVEENLHVQFSENTPNITGYGPNWLFDIDVLTKSMNYKPAVAENQSNDNACTKACDDAVNAVGGKKSIKLSVDPNMPALEDYSIFDSSSDDQDVGAEADMNNLDAFMPVNPIPTTRVHKDHHLEQVIGDLQLATQTKNMTKNLEEYGIEAIRLFLAYASFKDFMVYQMDVKSSFLYDKIEEEVYVCQPPIFEDPNFPGRVHKVEKALYGLHQAPRAWYETLSTYLLDNGFRRGKIDKTLFIRRDKGDILLVQVYVDDIIFGSTKKSLCKCI
ncbi:ribonuclease H-like domain-containing protein [Tanacetum coccineum]